MKLHVSVLPVLAVTIAAIPIIPTLEPPTPPTSGIVATADGTIFFVDSFHETVWRIDPGMEPVPFVTNVKGGALQLGPEGDLYGTNEDDAGRLVIWRADAHGRLSTVRSELPADHRHAIAVDDAGEFIGSLNDRRTGVRLWRGGMTRAGDGSLLLTAGSTVRRIDAAGRVTTIAARERLLRPRHAFLTRLFGKPPAHLGGIAAAADGSIYVANTARAAVIRITADGRVDEYATSPDPWLPTGVAIVGSDVCVLEYGPGVQVRCIAADGRSDVIAVVRPALPQRTLASTLKKMRPSVFERAPRVSARLS